MQKLVHPLVVDEARLRELDVEKTVDVTAAGAEHPVFELLEIPCDVRSPDHRADGRAANNVRLYPGLDKPVYDANVRPAPGCSGAQCEANFWKIFCCAH